MYISRMGKPGEIFYEEVETLKPDGKNALVRMQALGMCGTDKHAYKDGSMDGQIWGHEYSAIVEDPGPRSDLKKGDRVAIRPMDCCGECEFCKAGKPQLCIQVFRGTGGCFGAAEYQLLRPDFLMKISDNVSDIDAALIEPTACVYHGYKKSGAGPGKTLLISGVGALTGLLCEVARADGVKKIVLSDGSERRAQPLLDCGVADAFVNSAEPGMYTKLMEQADNPYGYDAYIDIKGGVTTLNEHIVCLKNGGTAVIIAEDYRERDAINLYDLTEDEKSISGSYAFDLSDYNEILAKVEAGKLNLARHAGKVFKLSEAKQAFEHSFARDTMPGKIIVVPDYLK